MKLLRRQFLHLAVGAAALPVASQITRAQTYPSRPVRIVVGFPAGSAPDIIARLITQGLSERLGQQFVVENRPGAASNIGTEIAVKAPPDGYTLLVVVATNTVNATLYTNLNFDFIHDIVPVAGITGTSYGMLVNQSFPLKIVPEFIAYAKTNPGKINMASAGTGSGPHVAVQDDDRCRLSTHSVSWQLLARSTQRTGAGSICADAFVDRVHPRGYSARTRGYQRDAFVGSAEHPDRGRVRAGI